MQQRCCLPCSPKITNQAGGYHYLGNKDGTQLNGPIHALANIINAVIGSVAEAEVRGLYMNVLELSPMRTIVEELDHPQPPTLIQTDNSTADGIMYKTIKQKQSKAMNKRFYWLQDRVEQVEFRVFWAPGKYNLANYYTKYHSPATHSRLRPIYTYIEGKSFTSLQRCVEITTRTDRPKRPLLSETNSNSKISKVTSPYSNISDKSLYKSIQALKQRIMKQMNKLVTRVFHPKITLRLP